MPSKSSGVVKNPLSESAQPSSTATHGSTSRPSSNYGGRSQQIIGPQKGNWNILLINVVFEFFFFYIFIVIDEA